MKKRIKWLMKKINNTLKAKQIQFLKKIVQTILIVPVFPSANVSHNIDKA